MNKNAVVIAAAAKENHEGYICDGICTHTHLFQLYTYIQLKAIAVNMMKYIRTCLKRTRT